MQLDQGQTHIENQVEALLRLRFGPTALRIDVLIQNLVDFVHLSLTPFDCVWCFLQHIIILQRLFITQSEHAIPRALLELSVVEPCHRLAVVHHLLVISEPSDHLA